MNTVDVLKFLSEHPDGSFLKLADFNGQSFGTCSITGVSPGWEMHPDTDEFFYVIEGSLEMTLLRDQQESCSANSGSVMVVPKGVWHKPGAPDGAKFLYYTPGQSLYSEKEDPRVDES